MGFADLWNRTLVYFGIAEEDEWDDESTQSSRSSSVRTRNVPTSAASRRDGASGSSRTGRTPRPRSGGGEPRLRGVPGGGVAVAVAGPATVHLVVPRSFNDAQQIADKFKESIPVILNLQGSDQELSKRLIDFASGLTYALDGGMQRVADKVFLLTPRNVEVSAEERAKWLEHGGFYNQA